MSESPVVFDNPGYQLINEAREAWLRRAIDLIPFREDLKDALDVGCGAGYFSGVLSDLGLAVTGVDLRQDNIDVCRQRYPHCSFLQADLDRTDALGEKELPRYDLGLLFGFLYHVQSPLQTILHLAEFIDRLCIVSTRIAPGDELACYLYRENKGDAHNEKSVVTVPTEAALLSIFATAGFGFLYQTDFQPDHEQWDPAKTPDGLRFTFVAAREAIEAPGLRRLDAERPHKKWKKPQQTG